jgi:hypothetical protein
MTFRKLSVAVLACTAFANPIVTPMRIALPGALDLLIVTAYPPADGSVRLYQIHVRCGKEEQEALTRVPARTFLVPSGVGCVVTVEELKSEGEITIPVAPMPSSSLGEGK